MKARNSSLLLSLFVFLFFLDEVLAQCHRPTDSLALVALYNATDGPNWINTWDLNQPMDTWQGITLNGNGCVQRIWLNNNNLDGPLPEAFGDLNNLREFRAGNNNLSGNLPMSFYAMSNLETFWISNNEVSGTIPPEVGQLTSMRTFNLGSNNFSGQLPAEIGNLLGLTHFYFGGNEFEGTIPKEVGNLKNMVFFELYNNQLTGTIPSELSEINTLRFIRLYNNQLSGNIPYEFSEMSNLEYLNVAYNQLSGNIPYEFSEMSNLEYLNVAYNQLSGFVPDFSINNLPLTHLRIEDNRFTFEDLVGSHQFNTALIAQNQEFWWDVYEFAPQANLFIDTTIYRTQGEKLIIDLVVDENVGDNEYKWYKDGALLTTLVGTNELRVESLTPSDFGIYHCVISNPNIPDLLIESGEFTVTEVDCRKRDSLVLIELYQATDGNSWTHTWDLATPMNTWYGVTLDANGCVNSLDLDGDLSCAVCANAGNNLVGNLPASINRMTELIQLSLGENEQLRGEIPANWGKLSILNTLRLDANFEGTIPLSLADLPSLKHLDISGNQLTGSVPDFSKTSSNFDFISIQDNQLLFTDITPTINANETVTGGNFNYYPQAKISEDITITEDIGYTISLKLPIEFNPDNTYTWFKDGNSLGSGFFEYVLADLEPSDAGVFHCEITNSNAPDLTLQSGDFTLIVETPICRERDSLALVAFYNATGGTNWTNTWDLAMPMDTWYGVTLDGNGCVKNLDLDGYIDINCPQCPDNGNNLIGSIPNEFYQLDRLRGIYFSNNAELTGTLSNAIGQLEKLTNIFAEQCNLSGVLPTEIGNLKKLEQLQFNYNNFEGSLPETLNNLTNLKELMFWGSNLSGTIPDLGQLKALEFIGLSYNNFTGPFPKCLSELTNLKSISLTGNKLTGEIPNDLSKLENLQFLSLGENKFYGSIPVSLSNLPNLQVLELARNNLFGAIPKELSNGNDFENLIFYGNKLTGEIPESFDTLKVKALSLQQNALVGDINERLENMIGLEVLFLYENQFTGLLPNLSIRNPDLKAIDFSINNFTFSHILPNLNANTNLIVGNGGSPTDYRYFPQNKIYQDTTIERNIGDNLTIDLEMDEGLSSNVYEWYKNGNLVTTINGNNDFTINSLAYLDGGIYTCRVSNSNAPNLILESHPIRLIVNNPNCRMQDSLALVALYNATDGANWTNTWDLGQPMVNWYGVVLNKDGCVKELDLDGYVTIGDFCQTCSSNGNNLRGNLPEEIGDLSALTKLSLAENDLAGPIPNQIGDLINLEVINLESCQLNGSLPASMNNLFQLKFLHFGYNQLSGAVPFLGNLMELEQIYLFSNQFEGAFPNWLTQLLKLKQIDFWSNQITGNIPLGFDNLPQLESLDFRWNQLSGNLPGYLGEMNQLHLLSFDNNNLDGTIPAELAQLEGNISLPNNNFTGELPMEFVNHQNSALHINGNELEGDISTILAGMSNMFRLKLEYNNFTGVVPDLTIKNPGLVGLYLHNNKFTFEHLLPNYAVNKNLTVSNAQYETGYDVSPQQKIYKDTIITKDLNEPLIIDLQIDDTVTTNVYQWYKDGQLLTTINGNNELSFPDLEITDAGVYHCEIINPTIPELTLESHDITIEINLPDCYFHFEDLYDPLIPHTYNAQTTIESSGTVESNTTVNFIAGNSVTLKSGFHAESGSSFSAKIGNGLVCDGFVETPIPNEDRSKRISDFEKVELAVFPNPFQQQTLISYNLPKSQQVHLGLYSLSGQLMRTIAPIGIKEAGNYQNELAVGELEAGFYVVLLKTEMGTFSQKVIITR